MLDSIGQTISPNSIIVYGTRRGIVLAKVIQTKTVERMGYEYVPNQPSKEIVKKTERLSCHRLNIHGNGKLSLGYNTITLSANRVAVVNPANFSTEFKTVFGVK